MAQAIKKGGLSTVTMILAFLGMAGFLYWLSLASEPTEFAVAEEGEPTRLVTLSEYAQNPGAFDDRIELQGVEVQQILGTHAFFFEVPGVGSQLVRLDRELVADGLLVLPGDQGRVVGTVHAMDESVLESWEAEGVFSPGAEGLQQRQVAGAVPYYLLADEVQLTGTAEPEAEAPPASQEQ